MNAGIVACLVLVIYFIGYRIYSRFISYYCYDLRKNNLTPAHTKFDNIDYVPTKKYVLFGHHYASIAGLSPMLGPAVAVIWGWLPALLWVVFGSLLIGCVHDFGALVVSMRTGGKSIGVVAEQVLGKRAKILLHIIIFFLVSLGMGVFVYVIAFLFTPAQDSQDAAIHFPEALIPTLGLIILAVLIALVSKTKKNIFALLITAAFFVVLLLIHISLNNNFISFLGLNNPDRSLSLANYSVLVLLYAYIASVTPVWLLLQPRDFLNSLLLYLGLFLILLGVIFSNPEFNAPIINLNPSGAPPLFPFVFIIIACGSVSGFHALVASGTTAKQIDKEGDARFIGYGGMIGESLLGVVAILATTAGVGTQASWQVNYASWDQVQGLGPQVGGFILGASNFLSALGISNQLGQGLVSVIVVSFALTSLDSATRLLRYNIEEIFESMNLKKFSNRYLCAGLAVMSISFFAFYRVDGKPAGLLLWSLFGTTNQILAGLSLLVICFYVASQKKFIFPILVPMCFVLLVTLGAMIINIYNFYIQSQWVLFVVGIFLFIIACCLIFESIILLRKKDQKNINSCEVSA